MEQNFDAFYFILSLSSSRILFLPRIKAAQFLGCIYILLLHAHCFDKELAHGRDCRSREQKTETYMGVKLELRIGTPRIKQGHLA